MENAAETFLAAVALLFGALAPFELSGLVHKRYPSLHSAVVNHHAGDDKRSSMGEPDGESDTDFLRGDPSLQLCDGEYSLDADAGHNGGDEGVAPQKNARSGHDGDEQETGA